MSQATSTMIRKTNTRRCVLNLSTIDNRVKAESNWIQRIDNALPRSVHAKANEADANFDVLYETLGWQHPDTEHFVWNTYNRGAYKGQATDQVILRADNYLPMGNVSGQYPDRDGYRHVYDVLEDMFPQSCESVTMYGGGQQVVVEQVLNDEEPIDLGNGDVLQPFIYTRMSLNQVWKTEIIPVSKRLACENMLGTGGHIIGVRATKNHDQILSKKVVEESQKQGLIIARMARVMKDKPFTDNQFIAMMDSLLPEPAWDADITERTRQNISNKRHAIRQAWRQEHPDMWGAYNAFQGAEQHRINIGNYTGTNKQFRVLGETVTAQEKCLLKTLDSKGTKIADEAEAYLQGLISYAYSEEPF